MSLLHLISFEISRTLNFQFIWAFRSTICGKRNLPIQFNSEKIQNRQMFCTRIISESLSSFSSSKFRKRNSLLYYLVTEPCGTFICLFRIHSIHYELTKSTRQQWEVSLKKTKILHHLNPYGSNISKIQDIVRKSTGIRTFSYKLKKFEKLKLKIYKFAHICPY